MDQNVQCEISHYTSIIRVKLGGKEEKREVRIGMEGGKERGRKRRGLIGQQID